MSWYRRISTGEVAQGVSGEGVRIMTRKLKGKEELGGVEEKRTKKKRE